MAIMGVVSPVTFFISEAQSGAASFTFTHPRTAASVTARFIEPPSYVANGPFYTVSVKLEILP